MYILLILSFICVSLSLYAATPTQAPSVCQDATCTQPHEEKTACPDTNCTDQSCSSEEEDRCDDENCTDNHEEEETCSDAACTEDHAEPKKETPPLISNEALENYKVTFGKLEPSNYIQTINVPAKIQRQSQSTTNWVMRMPGRILSMQSLRVGTILSSQNQTVLLSIARDPIELPDLAFVSPILKPNPTELQGLLNELQKCKVLLETLTKEYTRLVSIEQSTTTGSLIPRKTLIDLQNQIQSQTAEMNTDLFMLERFGFTQEELSGKNVTALRLTHAHYLRALKLQGYWNTAAQKVYDSLDSRNQNNYWIIAGLGELVAKNYLNEVVANALIQNEQMRYHIVDTLALLLKGTPISTMIALANEGWLHPVVNLRLPKAYHFYTLESVDVKVGGYYSQGDAIATLCDLSQVELACRPLGTERALFTQAAQLYLPLSARPLLKNAGPILDSLHIDRFEQDAEGEKVIINVPNVLLKNEFYQLREQMDYVVELPTEKELKNIYVVPLEAVTDLGSDKVIILKQGNQYVQAKVIVLYQDGTNAILSSKSQFHKGNIYAKTGAFRLNLAIQKAGGQQTFDAHAGCSH